MRGWPRAYFRDGCLRGIRVWWLRATVSGSRMAAWWFSGGRLAVEPLVTRPLRVGPSEKPLTAIHSTCTVCPLPGFGDRISARRRPPPSSCRDLVSPAFLPSSGRTLLWRDSAVLIPTPSRKPGVLHVPGVPATVAGTGPDLAPCDEHGQWDRQMDVLPMTFATASSEAGGIHCP